MRKNPGWISVLCAFATGCATYKEPPGGSTASIRFVTSSAALVEAFDPAKCSAARTRVAALGARLNASGRKKMGLPLGEEFEDLRVTEVSVVANQPFYFSMGVSYGNTAVTSCRVDIRLDPSPGGIYEAAFEYQGREGRCRIDVNEIVRVSDGKYQRAHTPAAARYECGKK